MDNWLSTKESYFSNVFRVGQFSVEVAAGTHIGRKAINQDSFGISYENGRLRLVVADGAGSRQNAEYASAVAVREYCSAMGDLRQQAHKTNATIIDGRESLQPSELPATTVAVLDLEDTLTKGFSLGDSRIYCHQRDQYRLRQLTRDHIYGAYKERLTGSPATHGERSRITLYLGNPKFNEALTMFEEVMGIKTDWSHPLSSGQIYLLCTDGLFHKIPRIDYWLNIVLARRQPLTKLVQDLIDDALGQCTRDNITIALARVSSS